MDFSWDQLVNDVKTQATAAWDNAVKTGVPAIKASLEQQAIQVLQKSNAETQKALTANVQQMLKDPNQSALGQQLAQAGKSAVFQEYGIYIVGGLVIVGFLILRK